MIAADTTARLEADVELRVPSHSGQDGVDGAEVGEVDRQPRHREIADVQARVVIVDRMRPGVRRQCAHAAQDEAEKRKE